MKATAKTAQLQIRVTAQQKRAIQAASRRAGTDMSGWVLSRILPSSRSRFQELTAALARAPRPRFVVAELHDLLADSTAADLRDAISEAPAARLDPYWGNYLAAMVETAAQRRGLVTPAWTAQVRPLPVPTFGSDLQSLRLHLLTASPPAFRRRNIFIDATVGDRV